jgi:2-hydroxychromene-2-carboxylate isomerase
MTVLDKLKAAAINAYLGAPGQSARAAVAEARRVLAREGRRVDFYYDISDPQSHLMAQAVDRLARAYPIDFAFHLVSPPATDVDVEPVLRGKHSVRDAIDLATHWDVTFPGKKELEAQVIRRAGSVLVKDRPFADQIATALEVGAAMWANDHKLLMQMVGKHGADSMGTVLPYTASAYTKLRARGGFQGSSLAYGGEWFIGLDRILFLQERLAADTGMSAPPVLTVRPADSRPPQRVAAADRVPLDFWFSFRSPYSYLALARLDAAVGDWPVELRLRPVLPLEQRARAMAPVKRLYIARDAKRIADRLGIPFGNLCDPLGAGAENCTAIARAAIDAGRGMAFARSAATAIWSEARDMTSYVDLRFVVERAGMSWDMAKAALADTTWRDWAKTSAEDLAVAGLWGVPSFRAGDYATWGQDRIDMLADRLRRHAAAPPPAAVPKTSE